VFFLVDDYDSVVDVIFADEMVVLARLAAFDVLLLPVNVARPHRHNVPPLRHSQQLECGLVLLVFCGAQEHEKP